MKGEQFIPEVGARFMVTEIGGKTIGPLKRVATPFDGNEDTVYAVDEDGWDYELPVKDCVFMDAPVL